MLKIYRAFAEQGKIKLQDHIDFTYGMYDTGLYGFGTIKTNNLDCTRVNYELQRLEDLKKYLQSIKCNNGFVKDFVITNPCSHQMIESKFKDVPKTFASYEQHGLNEEGILLFTDLIRLEFISNSSVQRIFGRYPENGMYLIMPNASFDMIVGAVSDDFKESYKVLQGASLGKKLVLQKINR